MTVTAALISGSFVTPEMEQSWPNERSKSDSLLTRNRIATSVLPLLLLFALVVDFKMDPNTLANVAIAAVAVTSFAITGVGIVYSLRNQVRTIAAELNDIQKELVKFRDVLVIQGRHDERISYMHATIVAQGRRIDSLTRRFDAFVDLKLGEQATEIDEEAV